MTDSTDIPALRAQDSYTHRLGWKLLRGPIPDGMELHHRCGVYACENGSWQDSLARMVDNGRYVNCSRRGSSRHRAGPVVERRDVVPANAEFCQWMAQGCVSRQRRDVSVLPGVQDDAPAHCSPPLLETDETGTLARTERKKSNSALYPQRT
jgi:HNH endonuclease